MNEYLDRNLIESACDRACSLGLLTRNTANIHDPTQAKVAGLTLKPSPVPKTAYQTVVQNQTTWHQLFANILNFSNPDIADMLKDVNEEFIEKLLKLKQKIDANSYSQIGRLQFYRNDYMIDQNGQPKQIEINTIAVSILLMAENIKKVHQYVDQGLLSEPRLSQLEQVAENQPLTKFLNNFQVAQQLYVSATETKNSPRVLFVVENERINVFDMRSVEYGLLDRFRIKSIFLTFEQLAEPEVLKLDSEGRLFVKNHEVSIVYYRTGYNPTDYPLDSHLFEIRYQLEISRAIKCPCLDYQFLTFKKIQIELSRLGPKLCGDTTVDAKCDILDRYLAKTESPETIPQQVKNLQATFVEIHQACVKHFFDKAVANPDNYVLKEQREGGTEILTGEDVKTRLLDIEANEGYEGLCKWVIMERINPKYFETITTKEANLEEPKMFKAISELGIYSAVVEDLTQNQPKFASSEVCGYLLRSKGQNAKSGGFATGVASCDDFYFV